jgi:hypothetical protein
VLSLRVCILLGWLYCPWVSGLSLGACIVLRVSVLSLGVFVVRGFLHCPWVSLLSLCVCLALGCMYCPCVYVFSLVGCAAIGRLELPWPTCFFFAKYNIYIYILAQGWEGSSHFYGGPKGPWVPMIRHTPKGEADTQRLLPTSPPCLLGTAARAIQTPKHNTDI